MIEMISLMLEIKGRRHLPVTEEVLIIRSITVTSLSLITERN